jgi:hypothetical protein
MRYRIKAHLKVAPSRRYRVLDPRRTEIHVNSGKWPPVRAEIRERDQPWTLTLFFAHVGVAPPFLGFGILLDQDDHLRDVVDREGAAGIDTGSYGHVLRSLRSYVAYAQAEMAMERDDRAAAIETLRVSGRGRRGFDDRFYREIAAEYNALVGAGERHPIKALAEARAPIHKSRASRWISEARRRGYIQPKEDTDGR